MFAATGIAADDFVASLVEHGYRGGLTASPASSGLRAGSGHRVSPCRTAQTPRTSLTWVPTAVPAQRTWCCP